jgi:hypothetical protein
MDVYTRPMTKKCAWLSKILTFLSFVDEVYVYKIPPLKNADGHRYVHQLLAE